MNLLALLSAPGRHAQSSPYSKQARYVRLLLVLDGAELISMNCLEASLQAYKIEE